MILGMNPRTLRESLYWNLFMWPKKHHWALVAQPTAEFQARIAARLCQIGFSPLVPPIGSRRVKSQDLPKSIEFERRVEEVPFQTRTLAN